MASVIETKINRISQAVSNALSAVAAKGVTVPNGAGVDALAGLIGTIEGGLPAGIAEMSTGEYVFASDESGSTTVNHGLSERPHLFAFINQEWFPAGQIVKLTGTKLLYGVSTGYPELFKVGTTYLNAGVLGYYNGGTDIESGAIPGASNTSGYLNGGNCPFTVPAGTRLKWIAVRFSV